METAGRGRGSGGNDPWGVICLAWPSKRTQVVPGPRDEECGEASGGPLPEADLGKISEKVAVAKAHIVGLTATTKHLEEQVRSLTKKSAEMEAKLEDQEERSRRNNMRVVGVPEGMDGPSTDLFMEDLILNNLKPKELPNFFLVENVHKVPGPLSNLGAPPRIIVASILSYRDETPSSRWLYPMET
ncbi:hypothetical protein NDU88_000225 [Pleurodeles waltl]|uniref:Uncharacterized protein n=1 Tax=Pleurodeles waltl TaxID=8319 RepID=A0AAV7R3J7_PLEWA|nr:hypothetical protein NDU88_000225 [Pleurodeles waltl]